MQRSIATTRTSEPESRFVQFGRSLASWFWSMPVAFGLRLWAVLTGIFGRRGSRIPDSINIDRVSAQLGIAKRARSDARNEYPPSGEEAVSGTQREIVVHFKELQRRAQRRIDLLAAKLRRMQERIDLAGAESRLRDIPSRCENDVLRMLAELQSRGNPFSEDAPVQPPRQQQDEEVESAEAGSSVPAIFQLGIMGVLVSAGTILIGRTSPFDPGAESPVPPLWIFLSLVAVVVLSWVTARAVTSSVSHYGSFWKLRKWLRIGTGIVFLGLASVFASHYLLALSANADASLSDVFRGMFVERTLPLLPFDDWRIVSIIAAAALLTFIVSYQPDAAAPAGVAPRNRRPRRTYKERDLLVRQIRKVNAKIDRAEAKVTAELKRVKTAIARYARLVDESERLPAKLADYDLVLEDACNMLLDRYRAENNRVRTTAAPESFQEHVCFKPEYEASLANLADEGRRLEEFREANSALESQASEIRQKLRDLNSRAINNLEETSLA